MIQFDEPAFNVYLGRSRPLGHRGANSAAEGLTCKTAVHICYGYGIPANIEWKGSLGAEWRQYERIFPALAASRIDQVSLECANSHVPIELLGLLAGKDVLVGAIDVASDEAETPEEVAATIEQALRFVPAERLFPCTNCGMAPLDRGLAERKLAALAAGAALVRGGLGKPSRPRGSGCVAMMNRRRNGTASGRRRGADRRRRPARHNRPQQRPFRLVERRQRSEPGSSGPFAPSGLSPSSTCRYSVSQMSARPARRRKQIVIESRRNNDAAAAVRFGAPAAPRPAVRSVR